MFKILLDRSIRSNLVTRRTTLWASSKGCDVVAASEAQAAALPARAACFRDAPGGKRDHDAPEQRVRGKADPDRTQREHRWSSPLGMAERSRASEARRTDAGSPAVSAVQARKPGWESGVFGGETTCRNAGPGVEIATMRSHRTPGPSALEYRQLVHDVAVHRANPMLNRGNMHTPAPVSIGDGVLIRAARSHRRVQLLRNRIQPERGDLGRGRAWHAVSSRGECTRGHRSGLGER